MQYFFATEAIAKFDSKITIQKENKASLIHQINDLEKNKSVKVRDELQNLSKNNYDASKIMKSLTNTLANDDIKIESYELELPKIDKLSKIHEQRSDHGQKIITLSLSIKSNSLDAVGKSIENLRKIAWVYNAKFKESEEQNENEKYSNKVDIILLLDSLPKLGESQ